MSERKIIEARTREQIAEFFPSALEKAIQSYRDHMAKPYKPEDFADTHKQAKVALAHIELLIKLAKWADLSATEGKPSRDQVILEDLLLEAQIELEDAGYNV